MKQNWFRKHFLISILVGICLLAIISSFFGEENLELDKSYLSNYNDQYYNSNAATSYTDYSTSNQEESYEDYSYDDYPSIKELHWGKMPINYYVKNPNICGPLVMGQIEWAFNAIQNETNNVITFENREDEEGKGISIECFGRYSGDVTDLTSRVQADARVTYVYNDSIENVIYAGEVRLLKVTPGMYVGRCGDSYPNTIVHEILHLFGFEDNFKGNSIMYAYIDACNEEIDADIINQLKETYAKQN